MNDEQVMEYLASRDAQAQKEIDARLDELTQRERSLVRDAAVMGYVQGRMDERARVEMLKDEAILRLVIHAVLREDENFRVLRGEAHHYTVPKEL